LNFVNKKPPAPTTPHVHFPVVLECGKIPEDRSPVPVWPDLLRRAKLRGPVQYLVPDILVAVFRWRGWLYPNTCSVAIGQFTSASSSMKGGGGESGCALSSFQDGRIWTSEVGWNIPRLLFPQTHATTAFPSGEFLHLLLAYLVAELLAWEVWANSLANEVWCCISRWMT
jgi:hypothetical protein